MLTKNKSNIELLLNRFVVTKSTCLLILETKCYTCPPTYVRYYNKHGAVDKKIDNVIQSTLNTCLLWCLLFDPRQSPHHAELD
jgi:hypothetical protein